MFLQKFIHERIGREKTRLINISYGCRYTMNIKVFWWYKKIIFIRLMQIYGNFWKNRIRRKKWEALFNFSFLFWHEKEFLNYVIKTIFWGFFSIDLFAYISRVIQKFNMKNRVDVDCYN